MEFAVSIPRSDNTLSKFFSHQILGSEEVEGEEQLAPENSAFDGFGLAGKKISRARILLSLLFTATTDIFECFSTNGLQFVYKDFTLLLLWYFFEIKITCNSLNSK